MKTTILIVILFTNCWNSHSQCDTPNANVSNIDCSTVPAADIITSGSVNSGQVKYVTTNSPGNIAVGTGGVLYVCGDITVSIGTGSNLLSMNGGTIVITSCATVNFVSNSSPTYINSGAQIVNYGTLNITQNGSFIRMDNGAKLFNYSVLNMDGIVFLKDASIINDNDGNHSYIETVTMRMGGGGSTVYANSSSKLCLAENSCLENNVMVNATNSNWLEYGGGTGGATLYGTTNMTGNGGSISNDPEINVCTTDNDTKWGSTNYLPIASVITDCSICALIDPCLLVLPVELVDFNVESEPEFVSLSWSTVSELNNDRFEIERLTGSEWAFIGEVKSTGNSNSLTTYEFKDRAPQFGISYYRLRQVDLDGTIEYSEVRVVDYEGKNIIVFPNPANNEVSLNVKPQDLDWIEVYTVHGQNVTGLVQFPKSNADIVTIDISRLEIGGYLIRTDFGRYRFIKI
ncbi:MAG: hypothetical protein ACJA0U_000972 [Salibacteraceae bacterium]|jgi:hypothetical protein